MLNFLKRLFRKKQPERMWPVADPKNIIIKQVKDKQ